MKPLEYLDPTPILNGQEPATGIYEITNEAYHSGPAVSKSMLDTFNKSPRHFWAAYLDPNRNPRESTTAFDIGTVVHGFVLEPDSIEEEYVVPPEINRRTKAGKAEWAEFLEANEGKIMLTQEQLDMARYMADSILEHPVAGSLFSGGLAEKSFYWKDPATGLLCRVRPDYLREDVLVDLKTTRSADAIEFAKSVANYRYFVQAPYYCDGVRETTGGALAPDTMIFVGVEKTPPYLVNTFVLDERAIAQGRKEYRSNLKGLAECMRNDRWPGYDTTIKSIDLPGWYYHQKQQEKERESFVWQEPEKTANGEPQAEGGEQQDNPHPEIHPAFEESLDISI